MSSPATDDPGLFARIPAEALTARADEEGGLKRAVGALDLTALGIGAIIGTGIFVIIGEAIGDSGPAIVLSFLLAGITCVFSALSYAELASSIPISGSAYTYSYATMGELVAWIIGWDLLLEYGVSVAAVAVGWGSYLQTLLDSLFGIELPDAIASAPADGGDFNLPAVFLVAAVAALLVIGIRESVRFNSVMVVVKLGILAMFIVIGFANFNGDNLEPFAPNGFDGVVDAAALIFFAYIGFDAVSTTAEETKNPGRDLPIGIVGSLVIATIVYILVALAATGMAPADELAGADAPLAEALSIGGVGAWAQDVVSFGALIAITSVVLTVMYGMTRIVFTMARDGLLPSALAKLTPRRTPARITIGFGIFIALIAAFVPLSTIAEMVNIGTLFAFLLVNIGVIILRRTQPDLPRKFRVPFVPVVPVIGALLCIYLMLQQEAATWARFGIWLAIGLAIYVVYGKAHSKVRRGTV